MKMINYKNVKYRNFSCNRWVRCYVCKGSGLASDGTKCSNCDGAGEVYTIHG